MIDPSTLSTALSQKSPSGYPAYTKSQVADIVSSEDSFMGKKIKRAMDLGATKEQAISYFAFGSAGGKPVDNAPKKSFFDKFVYPAAKGIVDYGTAPAEAAVGAGVKGLGALTGIDVSGAEEVQNLPENLQRSSLAGRIAIPTAVGIGTAGLGFLPAAGITAAASGGASLVGSGLEAAGGVPQTVGGVLGRAAAETAISGIADVATLGVTRGIRAAFKPVPLDDLVKQSKKVVGEIIQGDAKSIMKAQQSLQLVETKGVSTYADLHQVLSNKVSSLATVQDSILDKVKTIKPITSFGRTYKAGGTSIVDNPVTTALKHMEELFSSTGDPKNYVRIQSILEHATNNGLNARQLNRIARDYGVEFGEKAFSKTGDPLTSVNARLYENTRKALKDAARSLLPDKASKILDEQMSNLYDTIRNVAKMEKKVQTLANKVQTRGMIERVSRLVGRGIDKMTFNGLRGFLSSMFPSNVGLKQMNSLQIQDALMKNLSKFDDLVTRIGNASDDEVIRMVNRFVTEEVTAPIEKANLDNMSVRRVPEQPISAGTKSSPTTLPQPTPPVNSPIDDLTNLTPEEKATGLIGGSDNVDDIGISSVTDAQRAMADSADNLSQTSVGQKAEFTRSLTDQTSDGGKTLSEAAKSLGDVPDDVLALSKTLDQFRKDATAPGISASSKKDLMNGMNRIKQDILDRGYDPLSLKPTSSVTKPLPKSLEPLAKEARGKSLEEFVKAQGGMADDAPNLYWHGSISGDLRGGKTGLHLGTKQAAVEALEARIGIPADGKGWTGDRTYSETLMAGKDSINSGKYGKYKMTGFNNDVPKHDWYLKDYPEMAKRLKFSDGTIPDLENLKPRVEPFKLTGEMSNSKMSPHEDFKANGYMAGQIKKGTAKKGYYYENVGEDAGSVSIVVPNGKHVAPVLTKSQLTDIWNKANPFPKSLEPLMKEARKYKSAEEFVKAQERMWRGSKFEGVGESPMGTFLTSDKNYAETFAKGGGKVNELFVDKGQLKVAKSVGKIDDMVAKERWEATDSLLENQFSPDLEAIKRLKDKGYNAFESYDGKQLLIFDNSLVKTKSQLTDIWNKANSQ